MGRRLNEDGISDRTELISSEDSQEIVYSISATMVESRSRATRLRGIVGICLLLALTGIVYLGYFCPDHVCALTNRESKESAARITGTNPSAEILSNAIGIFDSRSNFRLQSVPGSLGYDDLFANDSSQFDINAHDVMVFLHIQKTGKFIVYLSFFVFVFC